MNSPKLPDPFRPDMYMSHGRTNAVSAGVFAAFFAGLSGLPSSWPEAGRAGKDARAAVARTAIAMEPEKPHLGLPLLREAMPRTFP